MGRITELKDEHLAQLKTMMARSYVNYETKNYQALMREAHKLLQEASALRMGELETGFAFMDDPIWKRISVAETKVFKVAEALTYLINASEKGEKNA